MEWTDLDWHVKDATLGLQVGVVLGLVYILFGQVGLL